MASSHRASLTLLYTLFLLISYTLALPHPVSQPPSASSISSRHKYLRPQKKFCISWLHGATPLQSTQTVSSTVWMKRANPTSTPQAVAVNLPSPGPIQLRDALAAYRRADRPRKIPRFTDEEITEACLLLIYGKLQYDPATKTDWITSTLLASETPTVIQIVPLTLTLTEMATEVTTITSTRMSTQTLVANDVLTEVSTQVIPTTLTQLSSDIVTLNVKVASTQTVPSTVIQVEPTTLTQVISTTVLETSVATQTATKTSLQLVEVTSTAQSTLSQISTETLTEIIKTTATAQRTLTDIEYDTVTSTSTDYTTTTSTITSTILAVVTNIVTLTSVDNEFVSTTVTPAATTLSPSLTTSASVSASTPEVTTGLPQVAAAEGQTCLVSDETYTCTYVAPVEHNGLVTSFTAPCTGTMKVQLDGGHGGNNYNNGGFAPGLSVSSQIKLGPEKSLTIPDGTLFAIYIGGKGNSGYYDNNSEGGFNGGGNGDADSDASGGGGATDIRYQGERLAVAAGGGGNGYSEGSDGYGNAQMPTLYMDYDGSGKGQDTTYWGAGAGGGGYRGGQEGMYEGEGGYTGSDLGDVDLGAALGLPQAIVTFTCDV